MASSDVHTYRASLVFFEPGDMVDGESHAATQSLGDSMVAHGPMKMDELLTRDASRTQQTRSQVIVLLAPPLSLDWPRRHFRPGTQIPRLLPSSSLLLGARLALSLSLSLSLPLLSYPDKSSSSL